MAERRPRPVARPSGQHFLGSDRLARELVAAAGVCRADLVVDLGAGDGRLTSALARRAGAVVAVEDDPRLVARLRERFRDVPRVQVVGVDLHHYRWPREPFRVVANPPFAATTFLLRELLAPARRVQAVDLVVQHGAAIKRTRRTGHALNVSWLPWWSLSVQRPLPAGCFRPPPRVDAALLSARRRDPPLLPTQAATDFARFVEAGFRRGRGHDAPVEAWVAAYRKRATTRRGPA